MFLTSSRQVSLTGLQSVNVLVFLYSCVRASFQTVFLIVWVSLFHLHNALKRKIRKASLGRAARAVTNTGVHENAIPFFEYQGQIFQIHRRIETETSKKDTSLLMT